MRLCGVLSGVAIIVSGIVVEPSLGSAYCRTTTIESAGNDCPKPCVEEGLPLFWPKRELVYTLNDEPFPDLTPEQLQGVFDSVFGAWQGVQCEGEPIDLAITQDPETTTLRAGPQREEPNPNVLAYVPPDEWEGDRRAFAVTKIWYNGRNGHILGADILFNGNMDPFAICPEAGCPRDEVTDLANVLTHEVGHFLGLAHSDVKGATMWCDAAPGDTDKRTLDADDIDGLCSMYGPSAYGIALRKGSSGPSVHGESSCSVGASRGGSMVPVATLVVLLLGVGWRGRRRA